MAKKPTSIKLDQGLVDALKERAEMENRTFGNLVESILKKWIESKTRRRTPK